MTNRALEKRVTRVYVISSYLMYGALVPAILALYSTGDLTPSSGTAWFLMAIAIALVLLSPGIGGLAATFASETTEIAPSLRRLAIRSGVYAVLFGVAVAAFGLQPFGGVTGAFLVVLGGVTLLRVRKLAAVEVQQESGGISIIPHDIALFAMILGLLTGLILPIGFASSKVPGYYSAMRSDLRNLVTYQEAFLADWGRYSRNTPELSYRTSTGVTGLIVELTSDGWTAEVGHEILTTTRCYIYEGSEPIGPARAPYEPACDPPRRTGGYGREIFAFLIGFPMLLVALALTGAYWPLLRSRT